MFVNMFGEVINTGDFVYYSSKGCHPRIFLVREIIQPEQARSAARVTTFARYTPWNREMRRYETEYVVHGKRSYIHFLQYAIPVHFLPPNTHPDIVAVALAEQRAVREGV